MPVNTKFTFRYERFDSYTIRVIYDKQIKPKWIIWGQIVAIQKMTKLSINPLYLVVTPSTWILYEKNAIQKNYGTQTDICHMRSARQKSDDHTFNTNY